jgi:glycosyltransferase involved in cell wall biosynthesis
MKVLINTNYKSAGSKVCVDDLSVKLKNVGFEVRRNDWDNYQSYDLILFMSPDSEVIKARKMNPKALVGLMDPKITSKRKAEVESASFLLVSSLEQKDFFLKYNKNVFVYYMFPEIESLMKEHKDKDKIIIGYHGNKLHLDFMSDASKALDDLSEKYNIEFWAIYNIKNSGEWRKNLPKKCFVKHIQWSGEDCCGYLSQTDIGIVPAKIPVKFFFRGFDVRKKYDYVTRFKYSTNPGRIYPFSKLGIPVVADFMPSYCQLIEDGKSGFLVYSKEGWYSVLEKLINSSDLRNRMSNNLNNFINNNCSPDINFKGFLEFIEEIKL